MALEKTEALLVTDRKSFQYLERFKKRDDKSLLPVKIKAERRSRERQYGSTEGFFGFNMYA